MGCGSSSPDLGKGRSSPYTKTNKAPVPLPRPESSTGTVVDNSVELQNSHSIEKQLDLAKQKEIGKVKLLLLGAGESGKSTIFKQMRILYGEPPSEDDLRMYAVVVRSNVVVAMRKLCTHLRNLNLENQLGDEEANDDAEESTTLGANQAMTPKEAYDELIASVVDESKGTPPPQVSNGVRIHDWVGQSPRAGFAANNNAKQFLQHVKAIRTLWQSKTMKKVWSKRAAMNVIDGHKEYLDDVIRIASPQFRPNTQDILLARMETKHVVKQQYRIDGVDYEMYDVGGQRSERRKWIDCFDHVDAVIFVAALSEYDQTLAESRRKNRMEEALELFRSFCNIRAFANTSIILFLNKKDIFAEKVLYSDISAQRPFSDYAGPPKDFDHGVLYFTQKFKEFCSNNEFNDSFIHVTCATDTNNMEFVLDATRNIIMTDNLRRSGYLND